MSDPTPEQMRALARTGPGPDESGGWATDVRAALRAAADEMDRLRDAESRAFADRAQALVSLGKQLDTNTHLRTLIENAPHAEGCGHVEWDADGLLRLGQCTCWKADAL